MQKQQLLVIIFRDRVILFLLISVICIGCFLTGNISANDLSGGAFASKGNHAYGGQNKFIFTDTSFIYYGTGPAKPVSKGSWHYSAENHNITLKTNHDLKQELADPISTVWLDLSDKTIKVLSKDKLNFDNIIYYRQNTN